MAIMLVVTLGSLVVISMGCSPVTDLTVGVVEGVFVLRKAGMTSLSALTALDD